MSAVHDPNAGVISTPVLDTKEGGQVSDYTPTTEDVRRGYMGREWWAEENQPVGAEFDRWLALHDAEVAAAAVEVVMQRMRAAIRRGSRMGDLIRIFRADEQWRRNMLEALEGDR